MSIFLKLAQRAVKKAGLGTLTPIRRVRRVKQLPGTMVVRMRDPMKRQIYVHFTKGQRHAADSTRFGQPFQRKEASRSDRMKPAVPAE